MHQSFAPTTPHSTQDSSRELSSPSHVAEHRQPPRDRPLIGPNGEQVDLVLPESVKLEFEPPKGLRKRR